MRLHLSFSHSTKARRSVGPVPNVVLTTNEIVTFEDMSERRDFKLDQLVIDLQKLAYVIVNPQGTILNLNINLCLQSTPVFVGCAENYHEYSFSLKLQKKT